MAVDELTSTTGYCSVCEHDVTYEVEDGVEYCKICGWSKEAASKRSQYKKKENRRKKIKRNITILAVLAFVGLGAALPRFMFNISVQTLMTVLLQCTLIFLVIVVYRFCKRLKIKIPSENESFKNLIFFWARHKNRRNQKEAERKIYANVYGLDTVIKPEGTFYSRHKNSLVCTGFLCVFMPLYALYNIGNEHILYLSNIGKFILSILLLLSGVSAFVWCKFYDNCSLFVSTILGLLAAMLAGFSFGVILTIMKGILIVMTDDLY